MSSQLWACVLIALGGGCGAVLRYLTNLAAQAAWGADRWPWGTLLVNLSGCFLLGFLVRWEGASLPEPLRLTLGVGFLGGLTTFSTFGVETWQRLQGADWIIGLANIGANVVGGLLAVAMGMGLAGALLAWLAGGESDLGG